jgi:hypothetical protein
VALSSDDALRALERALAKTRRELWWQSFRGLSSLLLAAALAGIAAYLARHQVLPRPPAEILTFSASMIGFALLVAALLVQAAAPTRMTAARSLEESSGGDRLVTYLSLDEGSGVDSVMHALFLADLRRHSSSLKPPARRPNGRFAMRVLVPLLAVDALLAVMPPRPVPLHPELALLREKLALESSVRDPALQSARKALLEARDPEALAARARELWKETESNPQASPPETAEATDLDALAKAISAGREAEARQRAEAVEEAAREEGEDAAALANRMADAARRAAAPTREQLDRLAGALRKQARASSGGGGFGLASLVAQQARQRARELASQRGVQDFLIRVFDELGEQVPDTSNRPSAQGSEPDRRESEAKLRLRPSLDRLPLPLREAGQRFLELRRARER